MIGIVLAAGAGRRLRPYTDTLPKALVPVDGETTILDITLGNLAEVGLTEVVIVVGYARTRSYERQADLEEKYGVTLTLVHNDKAEEWNNAYSLWLAREYFARGRAAGQRRHRAPGDRGEDPARRARPGHPARRRHRQAAGRGGDEDHLRRRRPAHPDHQADGPGRGVRRVHRRDADRAAGRRRPRRRAGGDLASGTRTSTTRTATRSSSTGAARCGRRRSATSPGSRSTTTTTWPGRGRSRAATSPDASSPRCTSTCGAARSPTWRAILADGRISSGGDVAVVVGPGQGAQIAELIRPSLRSADVFTVAGGTLDAADELGGKLRARSYDAVVGIGGGKTIDVAKYAATRRGLPMVVGGDQPRQRRHRLAGGQPDHRRDQGLVRRAHPDRGDRRPGLRGERPGPAQPGRHRRRDQQHQRAGRLGAGPAGPRRAGRRAGRLAGPDGRRGGAQPPRRHERRRLRHRARRGA